MFASGIGNEYGYTADPSKGGKGGKGGKVVSGFQPPNLYFQANPSQTFAASAENTEEHLVEHPPKAGDFELTNNCLIEYTIDQDFDQDREKVMICYNLSSLPEILIKKNRVRFHSTKIEGGKSVIHIVDKKNMYPSSEIFMNKVLKLMNINQSSSVYLNSKEGNTSKLPEEQAMINARVAAIQAGRAKSKAAAGGGGVRSVANDLVFNPVLDCYVDREGKCFYADLNETTLEPIPDMSKMIGKIRPGVAGEQAQASNFVPAKERSRKRKNRRNRTRKN